MDRATAAGLIIVCRENLILQKITKVENSFFDDHFEMSEAETSESQASPIPRKHLSTDLLTHNMNRRQHCIIPECKDLTQAVERTTISTEIELGEACTRRR